jgi:D-3-phosphoglycerate dehydrogenase / 2-oxoglutarate reductase
MKAIITDHGFPNVNQERDIITMAGFELSIAQCKTAEEVIASCSEADALLVQWAPITSAVIDSLKNCKIIVRYGIGVDNVDWKAAAAKGIAVCNVPDYCINEVADHSLALALSLARQVPQTDSVVRGGVWKITPPQAFPAFRDTIFATAGFGRIARAVLERAKPFGFKLAAYDPFVEEKVFASAGIRRLTQEELFQQAGIISLHLPLTPDTKHFVSREQLKKMSASSIIVNTARGGLIDTQALAEVLTKGGIAGAGLDVFEVEPLSVSHALHAAPNLILTSHTAWYSGGSIPILQRKAAEEIVRGLKGEPLRNVVNSITALN